MNRVARFYKVSFDQFLKDYADTFEIDTKDAENLKAVKSAYDSIILPARATKGSAGYDIRSTVKFSILPGETIKIPTGIKCKIDSDWVLQLYPRSSVGFKYRVRLDNSVGIVDADYFDNINNEGHIFIKLTNCGNKEFSVEIGDAVVQGIFMQYGVTEDDNVLEERIGGIGSTNNNR